MFFEVANAISTTVQQPWNCWVFCNIQDWWDLILLIISIFVLISFILSIIFILYWGLLLILSWGKEDKIKPAINTIRYAILGIVITIASIFLFPIMWRLLWLDAKSYSDPYVILNKISDLWDKITWKSNVSPLEYDLWNDDVSDDKMVDFNRL